MNRTDAEKALKQLLEQLTRWQSSGMSPAWIKWRDDSLMIGSPVMESQINSWLGLDEAEVGGLTTRTKVLEALQTAGWTQIRLEDPMEYWKKL